MDESGRVDRFSCHQNELEIEFHELLDMNGSGEQDTDIIYQLTPREAILMSECMGCGVIISVPRSRGVTQVTSVESTA